MIRLKRLKNFISHRKIRTKLFLLILVAGFFCLSLFRFLWHKKWNVYYFLSDHLPSAIQFLPLPADDFWEKLSTEAQKYNIPDSEDDKEAVAAIDPFFSLADEYTSLYIYGLEDGLYRTGYAPDAMLWNEPFQTFFQLTYRWIDEDVDQSFNRPTKFKNGYAMVIVSFYHSSFFIVPYAVFCLGLCVFLFLFLILFFVGRKLKTVVRLEEDILRMASGDLSTPVTAAGFDEIGVLAAELDQLRFTLDENIRHEQKMHKSHQELIAALSHDLRTPLTILKGYLEILRLNRNKTTQEEYLTRCLRKTEDIEELTKRMFEYALVYDEESDLDQPASIQELPLSFFLEQLKEHADFLRIAGFSPETVLSLPHSSEISEAKIKADPAMAKRVLNNLVSNIIKYGSKKEAVVLSASFDKHLTIQLKNRIKTEQSEIESTQIGLKSAQKLMEHMDGSLTYLAENGCFTAELHVPSCRL